MPRQARDKHRAEMVNDKRRRYRFLFFLFFCMRCRHFRLHGVKMLCLQEVKRNKLMRDEADFAKDILDTVAIDRLLDA